MKSIRAFALYLFATATAVAAGLTLLTFTGLLPTAAVVLRICIALFASTGMLLGALTLTTLLLGLPAFLIGLAAERAFRAIGLRLPDPLLLRRRFAVFFPVPRMLQPGN